jgi:serine/threonine-protein kinase HipA
MRSIKKVTVSLSLANQAVEVGELVSEGTGIYFKYFASFIERGIEISPFKLKLSDKIYSADASPFDGLFGVFADSLPDGWGRLLMDRAFSSKGISLNDISPLDRLAYVGMNGMGALTYSPALDINKKKMNIELDAVNRDVANTLQGSSAHVEALYQLSGSSGGARPKILVGYSPKTKKFIQPVDALPLGYQYWLIKFPSSSDPRDVGNIEYAYHKMATSAGIEMSECKLFKGKSGNEYFGTKRFDRVEGNRLHLHSAAGLMHDNFRLSNMDYGHLMDCAFQLERSVSAYQKILRLAAFNVFAHNRDDHSKNFSFLMNEKGQWRLSPAYDLTFSNSSHGFHSTMVSGESQNPTKKHLMKLADYFKINRHKEIIQEVEEAVSKWISFAKDSGVGKESRERIGKSLIIK